MWVVKKILIYILFIIVSSHANAESVYDFLKKEYEYNRYGNFLNIYAHNSHSSKIIYVNKLEVMFQDCDDTPDGTWNNPDRVFNVNRTVYPRSDNHITVSARFPTSAKTRCYKLFAEFKKTNQSSSSNKKKSTNVYDLLEQQKKKKSKQSGSRSLLEKLLKRD